MSVGHGGGEGGREGQLNFYILGKICKYTVDFTLSIKSRHSISSDTWTFVYCNEIIHIRYQIYISSFDEDNVLLESWRPTLSFNIQSRTFVKNIWMAWIVMINVLWQKWNKVILNWLNYLSHSKKIYQAFSVKLLFRYFRLVNLQLRKCRRWKRVDL